MRRYWLDVAAAVTNEQGDKEFLIEGEDFHHICGVCRRGEGDKFEVLTEASEAYLVEVVHKTHKQALARVIESRTIEALPEPHIELCVSLPRFKKMDEIIEKSVEIGVYRVRPFMSDFSFIRDFSKLSSSKLKRWSKIVKSATQQCGRGELMDISPVVELNELLEEFNQEEEAVGLFPYEGESQQSLQEAIQSFKKTSFKKLWIFVGSEGGFSDQEVQLFSKNGLESTTLGPQILRVETACLALASIIKYELVQ